jgi:uncharacterized BrkB/YihY/UPF0761 family membrane protein
MIFWICLQKEGIAIYISFVLCFWVIPIRRVHKLSLVKSILLTIIMDIKF